MLEVWGKVRKGEQCVLEEATQGQMLKDRQASNH